MRRFASREEEIAYRRKWKQTMREITEFANEMSKRETGYCLHQKANIKGVHRKEFYSLFKPTEKICR